MFIIPEQLNAHTTAIVDTQSIGVDIISGAAADCQAIGAALLNAFAK